MHIDEDTHRTNKPKFIGNGMYLLRKRTVDLVVLSSLSTGPQEPRRPRFSFFNLHNVKELTPGTSLDGGVGGSAASEFRGQ